MPLAFGAAWAGSTCGITSAISWARTFGLGLIHRYGKYVHITEEQSVRRMRGSSKVGHWGLTFGYFIPGVRHVSGICRRDERGRAVQLRSSPIAAHSYGSRSLWGWAIF